MREGECVCSRVGGEFGSGGGRWRRLRLWMVVVEWGGLFEVGVWTGLRRMAGLRTLMLMMLNCLFPQTLLAEEINVVSISETALADTLSRCG